MPEQRPGSMEAVSGAAISPMPQLMEFFKMMDPMQLMQLLQGLGVGQQPTQQVPKWNPAMGQPEGSPLKRIITGEY